MADFDPLNLDSAANIKKLIDDLDSFLAVNGNFWGATKEVKLEIDAPDQVKDLCRDILVGFFGLEVQGL